MKGLPQLIIRLKVTATYVIPIFNNLGFLINRRLLNKLVLFGDSQVLSTSKVKCINLI